MESIIKWNTGNPNKSGRYLLQTKSDGFQIDIWSDFLKCWSLYNNIEVITWCNLRDIKPYKEE